jgi:hypothetical protein
MKEYNNTLSLIKYKNYKKLYLTKYKNQYGGDNFLELLNDAIIILNNFNNLFNTQINTMDINMTESDVLIRTFEKIKHGSNIQILFNITTDQYSLMFNIYDFTIYLKDMFELMKITIDDNNNFKKLLNMFTKNVVKKLKNLNLHLNLLFMDFINKKINELSSTP